MAYQAFRKYGAPTFYDAAYIPWEGDILTSGLIFCFGILALSFYIILPGLVGKEKTFSFVKTTVSLFIGAAILVCNFAMTWEKAEIQTITKYKAGTGQNVNVTVGVNIGLRGINITLKGEKDQIKGETIDYNENFNWEGLQGRLGFGAYAGEFSKQYRAAQMRGIPLPILTVAEYFTVDGEGIRWGRFYRQAGWYSHLVLWLAFPLWILSNILFLVLLRYGAYFLALTGLSMVTSNIIWATMRNRTELEIHFTSRDVLVFSYGPAFWVCLITGVLCILLGIVAFLLDKLFPSHAATFFGVDILQDSENIIVEEVEEPEVVQKIFNINDDAVDSGGASGTQDDTSEDDEDGVYKIPPPPVLKESSHPHDARPYSVKLYDKKMSFRTSEHRLTKRLQRPRRRDPPPRPPTQPEEDIDGDYQNAPAKRAGPSNAEHRVTFGASSNQVLNPIAEFHNESSDVTITNFEKI